MEVQDFDRRTLLKGGGAALAGMTVLKVSGPAHAFPGHPGEEEVLPWLDQPADQPGPAGVGGARHLVHAGQRLLHRQPLQPARDHSRPTGGSRIGGLVRRPQTLSLDDLKRRPRREVDFTLECSGNTGLPFFHGGVGNARWAGAQLAPILRQAGVRDEGIEVVFWGADAGEQIIRDNSGSSIPTAIPMAIPTTTTTGRPVAAEPAGTSPTRTSPSTGSI